MNLSLWLELDNIQENHDCCPKKTLTQVLKLGTPQSWATLRAFQFVDASTAPTPTNCMWIYVYRG
jgi:hypothetical protein